MGEMEYDYLAALDIGGTKMAAAVAGPEGPLARVTRPTPKSGRDRVLPEQGVEMIAEACAQAGIDPARVGAVGVASCGPFVKQEGLIALAAPNICGGGRNAPDLPNDWTLIPLEQVLREHYERVTIDNDCVAAIAAERAFGAAIDEPDCAYVTWSTGVGFGLCVDGRILRGKNGNAGHAGHMLLNEDQDAVCGCGNRGDLEGLISGRNLANRVGLTSEALFEAARAGDPLAREVGEYAAHWLGRGLYNLAAALDLRLFVIGGSVWHHHGEWLQPLVMRELESHLPALTAGVRIVPAALGSLVADIGAFTLVLPDAWVARWRKDKPWRALQD
ncbi:MAG TPA: ROK family protein [Noviherbaspirillum sp.]|jgi:glucokinase|uniref:ROK family protein n=1 Tax=Noviherbaspirillum sp. TaxID=1926288 RepID=UPI002F94CC25